MKIFVPQGVTCFLWHNLGLHLSVRELAGCINAEGRRAYPGRNPDTMVFHRVHKAIEEVSPIFDPATKHFILADTDEQDRARTVVFAIFTSKFEFLWRMSLDPCPGVGHIGLVWRRERMDYLPQQTSGFDIKIRSHLAQAFGSSPFRFKGPVVELHEKWLVHERLQVRNGCRAAASAFFLYCFNPFLARHHLGWS